MGHVISYNGTWYDRYLEKSELQNHGININMQLSIPNNSWVG